MGPILVGDLTRLQVFAGEANGKGTLNVDIMKKAVKKSTCNVRLRYDVMSGKVPGAPS